MNKKVLFIGVTHYNLKNPEPQLHLKKKFEGLSKGMEAVVLAKGEPFHKEIWNTKFYLLSPGIFFWPQAFFVAFWLCLTKNIDVIVAQSPLAEGFTGSVLKKILRKELIVEVHGDWEARFPSIRRILSILAKFSLKNADKIRAISTFTKEKARRVCPQKPYFVFPTFTDIDDFLKEENIGFDNFILFVGNIQKVKGIDILIKAFAKISPDFADFKLILVGDGPERQNLESRIQNLELEDKVEFKGRLSLKDTREVMKKCYCLVLPSLSEGLGRVLAEAEALSKPVIGSRTGGTPDLIEDGQNGFLFEVGNADELAEKLRILLSNQDLAVRMGQKGREFAKGKFSNEEYVAAYIKMINN